MVGKPEIEVIIRTTAESHRKSSLNNAINSVLKQRDVIGIPVVIVNGDRYDVDLFNELKIRKDIKFEYIKEASTGKAMFNGRKNITSNYFAFLDDDDELLEDALYTRWKYMDKDDSIDVVVTTGFLEINNSRQIHITNITEFQSDPLEGIIRRCWLSSCGGLFKSRSISREYFDGKTDHQEMTLLAFKIAFARKKVLFIDIPTYVVHDTPGSMSKTAAHQELQVSVLENMRSYKLPHRIKMNLERKYRNTLHVLAEKYLYDGQIRKAWHCHLLSMKPPFTLRYLAFTRKFMLPLVSVK